MASIKAVLILVAALLSCSVLYWRTHSQLLHCQLMFKGSNKTTYPELNSSPGLKDVDDSAVKKFVFFVGYARSGHSIIGALMDAHPHVVIAHEFFLFSMFSELNQVPEEAWKRNLFNLLYKKSVHDADKVRATSKKGYTLEVEGLWQGRFDKYIEVIGDKSGGKTTLEYLDNKAKFIENYMKLKDSVSIPIRIIHAVRNPFDIISTKLYYGITNVSQYRNAKLSMQSSSSTGLEKLHIRDKTMIRGIKWLFALADGVVEMIEEVFGRENVLEVHNCDLVDDPRETISSIFQFLELDISEHFLDSCAAKIFKSASRSRNTVEWSPEFIEMVEEKMKAYKMFDRYSFTSHD